MVSTNILLLAHRGACGYRPEHTSAAYELAVEMGADYIEPDLVMTADGVLVDRHEPDISETTDVADHPEFAGRRRTKGVDGTAVTGWFVDDFTLAELRTLRARERLGSLRPGSARFDGRYPVMTFEEVLRQRSDLARESGRPIGIIPEIKHSTYLRELGFDPEGEVTRLLQEHDLNARSAPAWVQSFEPTALESLRTAGYRGRSLLLTEAGGAPFDLREQGTTYADLLTPQALQKVARWADAISPEKTQVIPWTVDDRLGEPTRVVADAHAAGLEVFPWTFRAENAFLPLDYRTGDDPAAHGRLVDEVMVHLTAGIDGIFCDQPDVCAQARSRYVTQD
ncbi:glycerophosphodiester phosphodiesterase family protein [Janibacter cremeus]|uniref:glycerophosphodiester phosphodiesterase n=1 Tax=Janibacter cremeus TaxID=1285192 RepID=A0A852W1E1_9MICO|nr:glycerophosphodiester phosphodiesterase family protein [Janibacter cremeus]NYF99461.1 glycerophosphoryl diester phosphodiesterase [Janibacter cremeus]